MKNYNSVSTYDKNNHLVRYVSFSDEFEQPKCLYDVKANILNRIHVNEYRSKSETTVFEAVKSFIEFEDNIMLLPLQINGEVRMEIYKSGNTFSSIAFNVSDRFDTYSKFSSNKTEIENFRLKSNLIEDCLNRL